MRYLLASVLALVACGDDGVRHLPDAPDFTPDAPEPDAPTTGVVKLTVTSGSTGVMGVRVIFQNPDSSVVLSTTTDANGVASATMGVGGFVTAIDPFATAVPTGLPPPSDLRTFAGVKPGDQLVLHQDLGRPLVNVTVNLPIDAAIARYFLHVGCENSTFDVTGGAGSGSGSATPGGPLSIPSCGATTDLLLEGQDANGLIIKTLFKANVPVSEGGVIDLTADTYTAASTATFMYTNIPAPITLIDVENFVATTHGLMYDIFSSADVSNGMAALNIPAPAVIPGSLSVTLTDMFSGGISRHEVVGWGAATNTFTLDATNVLLPEYSTRPTFDIATHATSWTQAATGATPDFSVHTIQFNRPSNLQNWSWQIAAPFGTGPTVTLPVLPADGAMFNPVTDDQSSINELALVKMPGGYDAIRATVLAVQSPVDIAIGASGQAVVENLNIGKALRSPFHKARKTARRH